VIERQLQNHRARFVDETERGRRTGGDITVRGVERTAQDLETRLALQRKDLGTEVSLFFPEPRCDGSHNALFEPTLLGERPECLEVPPGQALEQLRHVARARLTRTAADGAILLGAHKHGITPEIVRGEQPDK